MNNLSFFHDFSIFLQSRAFGIILILHIVKNMYFSRFAQHKS